VTVQQMWWCPTCHQRIPQPRWLNIGKVDQRTYHLIGTIAHGIERANVLHGEVIDGRPAPATAPTPVPDNS
jgi:hypothetical protein